MHIDIISAVPELLEGPFSHSIIGRAASRDLLTVAVHDLKTFGLGRLHQIDDYAYGGGAGMVMMCEPLDRAIHHLIDEGGAYDEIIFMTPDAPVLHQRQANRLSLYDRLLILCGHYKGIDQRIRDHIVTMEISIGDYVLSGGELAAAVLVDAIGRLIPGVMNDGTSALSDSHQDGLLAPPVYTRPAEYNGWTVPDVLLSGHGAKIDEWRYEQSIARTVRIRPDMMKEETDS